MKEAESIRISRRALFLRAIRVAALESDESSQRGDPSWETLVPPRIVQLITQHKLFGYQPTAEH